MEPLAQRIRDNPSIAGTRFGGEEHKLCLYADDVVATVENPSNSLPAFLDELERLALASGFRINMHKWQALAMLLTPATKAQLQRAYPLQWAVYSVPYLGLQISDTIAATREAN